jgi:hypothetical protein
LTLFERGRFDFPDRTFKWEGEVQLKRKLYLAAHPPGFSRKLAELLKTGSIFFKTKHYDAEKRRIHLGGSMQERIAFYLTNRVPLKVI